MNFMHKIGARMVYHPHVSSTLPESIAKTNANGTLQHASVVIFLFRSVFPFPDSMEAQLNGITISFWQPSRVSAFWSSKQSKADYSPISNVAFSEQVSPLFFVSSSALRPMHFFLVTTS